MEEKVESHGNCLERPLKNYELEMIKDNTPEEGKKRLYAVQSLATAWTILDAAYEDHRLIAQKLKGKLKNVKVNATEEHEKVIEAYLEMDYLTTRIIAIGLEALLIHDPEY